MVDNKSKASLIRHIVYVIYRKNISLMKINNTHATPLYIIIFIRDTFFSVYVMWERFLLHLNDFT